VAELSTSARALAALFAALAGVIGAPDVAQAQTAGRAAQLFDAGIADLKLAKYATACAALEESHGLDANLGTLIALGDCLERWGKLHSAALRFEALIAALSGDNTPGAGAAASARRAPQLEYARMALARLTPRIPELRLTFPPPGGPELRVLLDGETLEASPPEQAVRIDPGHHTIETQAAGREPWRLELELKVGEHRSVELELGRTPAPELSPAAPPAPVAPAPALPAPALESKIEPEAAPVEVPEPETDSWRTLGWGLGGLGVMGIGLGTVAGIRVLQECPGFECPSQTERGQRLALLTDVGFGVGLAALAGSVVLLLSTDPPAKRVDPTAWRPLGALDARGGWLGLSHDF
jgi:hypothetical protein